MLSAQMNLGGNVVVLDGKRSYAQNEERQEEEDRLRGRPARHAPLAPSEGASRTRISGEIVEGQSLRGSGYG